MYGPLWRVLPGPWWLKVFILLILAAAAIYALMFWVFPWISPYIVPVDEVILVDEVPI